MNRNGPMERRETPRVDARLPLQLTETDNRLIVTTESVDLSRGGLACRTSDYVAPLSRVALTLILPPFGALSKASRSLRAEGVVVRCEEVPAAEEEGGERAYQLACCFTALEPDAQNLLEAFMAWRLLRSGRFEAERPARVAVGGAAGYGSAPRGRAGAPRRSRGRPGPANRDGRPRSRPEARTHGRTHEREPGREHRPARGHDRPSRYYGEGSGTRPERSERAPRRDYEPRTSSRPAGERSHTRDESRPPRSRAPRDARHPGERREGSGRREETRDRRPRGDRPARGYRERSVESGPSREYAPAQNSERPARNEAPATQSTRESEPRWGRRPQRRDSGSPRGSGRDTRR